MCLNEMGTSRSERKLMIDTYTVIFEYERNNETMFGPYTNSFSFAWNTEIWQLAWYGTFK